VRKCVTDRANECSIVSFSLANWFFFILAWNKLQFFADSSFHIMVWCRCDFMLASCFTATVIPQDYTERCDSRCLMQSRITEPCPPSLLFHTLVVSVLQGPNRYHVHSATYKALFIALLPFLYQGFAWLVEVEVTLRPTVSRSVCPGVRPPSGTHDQFYFLLQTVAFLLFCSALSVERTGL
jgi:hypothetical protein